MAKRKSKPSASQRDKINIARAKALKEKGIISKQAKLHGGHYISKSVLKKVRELGSLAGTNVKAYKAPKEIVQRAKERGFTVVGGNKVIGPATAKFRSNLKKGEIIGVEPVRGGYMAVLDLPHSIYDLHTLYETLGDEGLNALKNPDEVFAFNFHGNSSYHFFANVREMRDYLFQYKSIQIAMTSKPENMQEEFQAISLIRFHPEDQSLFIPTNTQRRLLAEVRRGGKRRRREKNGDGSTANRALSERARKKRAEYMKKRRAEMSKKSKDKYLEKARDRMRRNRSKRK